MDYHFTAQSPPTCETRLFLLTLRCCCCCLGLGCCCLFLCHLLLVVEALGCHLLDSLQHANTVGKQKSVFGVRRLLKALQTASSSTQFHCTAQQWPPHCTTNHFAKQHNTCRTLTAGPIQQSACWQSAQSLRCSSAWCVGIASYWLSTKAGAGHSVRSQQQQQQQQQHNTIWLSQGTISGL